MTGDTTHALPIRVINLDRMPERWDFVRAQFAAAGLADQTTRFSAIDASAPGFRAPGYAPHIWGDRWELETSEQAVFESHLALWRQVAERHPGGAVICEDDILVSQRFSTALQALDLPRFGVVKLDGFAATRRYGPAQQMGDWTVRPILEAVPSAACYAIGAEAARLLVAASGAYCETLDDFLFRPRPGLTPVQVFPAVAVQGMSCVAGPAGPIPGTIAESQRDGPARSRKAGKGPLTYRLLKEARRLTRKLAQAGGTDRRLIARGGGVLCPDLAADLPEYRA
ncbi:glycosyltransferase family 25 protein [Sedimentitalea sp. HM32M-2]|uniref:glycosyltransferase family 25 protein n=1 Tax=Sedimentitalea sp. HM32M-2 TaxID=3351566 RepID=UPI00363C3819